MLGIFFMLAFAPRSEIPTVILKAFLANKFDLSASAALRGFPARERLGVRFPMAGSANEVYCKKMALLGGDVQVGQPEEYLRWPPDGESKYHPFRDD